MENVVEYRRALHRIPELDTALEQTLAYVAARLEGLPCRLLRPTPGSLCAWFDAGRDTAVAFRADMDALPVTEETGLPYASEHPGVMHACGHDGHTAMALALAEWAAEHLADLPRNLLVIFQPAEETTGGALPLCETGLLEEYAVERVFAFHLWPGLPEGQVWSRPGPLMARSSEVTITLLGRSVHISKHAQGIDALAAGAEYLQRAYAMIAALPAERSALLRFGKMTSGTVRNAVSGHTRLEGSLRTYSDEAFLHCRQELTDIGGAVAEETGCAVAVHLSDGYPAVWNDEALFARVSRELGDAAPHLLAEPALAAEDFSFYQRRVPGVLFFLGVGDADALHAPTFAFDDEAVLPRGVEFLQKLALLN